MTTPVLATAATTAGLRSLPVDPADGFPQSFLLGVGDRTYRFELYVDVPEHVLDPGAGPRTACRRYRTKLTRRLTERPPCVSWIA